MRELPLKKVVVSWSGGIDSTAVLAALIKRGYHCTVVSADLYRHKQPVYHLREAEARQRLIPILRALALRSHGSLVFQEMECEFLWQFASPDGEIPMRNKRWIDLLMAHYVLPERLMNIALGEYVGVDTWLVRDHVPSFDCDHRALSAYLLHEYGIDYRLISLQDFGESRYKHQRLMIGNENLPGWMHLTTNCMSECSIECGECYKCVERAAAFHVAGIPDTTSYAKRPQDHPRFALYLAQMAGCDVQSSYHDARS